MMGILMVRGALAALVCTISMCAYAMADAPRPINVPPGDLATALELVSKKTGVELVFNPQQIKGIHTKGVSGTLSSQEAVRKLLEGTKLELRTDSATGAMMIGPSPEGPQTDVTQGVSDPPSKATGNDSSSSFRVAQVDQGSPPRPATVTNQDSEKPPTERGNLEEIVVTGTHIRGGTASLSPVMTFDRDAIDRSGYLNTQDFIQSIPQTFSGGAYGASPDGQLGGGTNAAENFEHASAVNLRGLGENATLVLLNGHRIAPSDYGNVVDISTIPLSAIDHIDVLTDGASAIYGADAVAGVVNIVLRSGHDGAETQATYGGASGGLRNEIFAQTFGKEWGSGSLMASYQYQHDSTLPTTARPFTAGAGQPTNLINPLTQNSLVVNGNQRIVDGLTLSGDVLATWKTTKSDVTYSNAELATNAERSFSSPSAINAHLGLDYAITERWSLDLNGTYSRERNLIGFDYSFGEPIPLGRYTQTITAPMSDIELNLSGHLFALPGGEVGLALGVSHRQESVKEVVDPTVAAVTGQPELSSVSRHVNAEYGELQLPILSAENNVPLMAKLVLSAAVRHDDYSDFGGTTNPKLGLQWSPVSFLDVKANWSRAFRAPSVGEQFVNVGQPEILVYPPAFITPSGARDAIITVQGANPHLAPETATTYDLGFDLRVPNLPGFNLSVDYYNVDFKNRIEFPAFGLNLLLNPSVYGSLITPFSNEAQAAAYVANLEAQGYQLTDVGFGTSLAAVRAAFPTYFINAAVVRQNGLDITAKYAFTVGGEGFQTSANAAFINKIDTQFAPGATVTNFVNTYSDPLRWRMRWDGAWTHGPARLATAINYSNAYSNAFSVPPSSIASFMTVDLVGSVKLARDDATSILRGTTLTLSAANLLNRYPPYAAGASALLGINYDVGNASPLGRLLSLQLLKKW
jgi:iron complex outermembrane receptor protein